jgi:hypothetical protein
MEHKIKKKITALLFYRHFEEANRNMQKYHKICHITQERYEKLANLGGSGGASGFKDGNMNDSAYDSQISPLVNSPEDTEPGIYRFLYTCIYMCR